MKIKAYIIFFILGIFFFQCCSQKENEGNGKEYNIILITIDTLRADHLHCYEYKYKTSPNIDAFAKKSIFFDYAYCPIPKTSASFASMMTGLHPFIHKTKPNQGHLKKEYITLAEALKLKGYYNVAIVDNANLSKKFYFNQGFDDYVQVWDKIRKKEESTPFITKSVISFLEKKTKGPFFLWANYIETHTPYMPPKEFIESRPKGRDINKVEHKIVVGMKKYIKQNPDEGYYISLYDGAVKYVDYEIGKIIDVIFKKGLDKNSIIIITADHGEDLGEYNFYFDHGPLTFNAASRVPLIVSIPGLNKRRIKYPVSIMDIYPTILNIAGLKTPYEIQGIDLFKGNRNRHLYIFGLLRTYAVVHNKYHYVKVLPKLSNRLDLKEDYLFNIYDDPYETNNIFLKRTNLSEIMNKKYLDFFEKHGYLSKNKNVEEKDLSEKEIENLKTLGYIK